MNTETVSAKMRTITECLNNLMEEVEGVSEDMCDHYCKYGDLKDEELIDICDKCPLNRLL